MKKIFKGFTLVELIVVITIVAILATVGFVAYTDYLKSTRDSNRTQQLASIYNGLELHAVKFNLPIPENPVEITFGATKIGIQGDMSQSILDTIKYNEGGIDPLSKEPFTYYLSNDRKNSQLLAFFEESNDALTGISQAYSNEYEGLFPEVTGAELGIVLQSDTNIPIQKIDVFATAGTFDFSTQVGGYVAYVNSGEVISGNSDNFISLVPNISCSSITGLLGSASSGFFKINPSGSKLIDVYCEMDDDSRGYGDGWTLIARTHPTGAGKFGWLYEKGNVYDDSDSYSMGSDVIDIRFSEIMIAPYNSGKNIIGAIAFDVDRVFFQTEMLSPDETSKQATSNCQILYNDNYDYSRTCGSAFRYWGAFAYDDGYPFERYSSGNATPFHVDEIRSDENSLSSPPISFNESQGMLFVR